MRSAALRVFFVVFCLGTFLAAFPFSTRADSNEAGWAVVDSVADDGSSVDVLKPANASRKDQTGSHIAVADATLKAQVAALKLKQGDLVDLDPPTAGVEGAPLKSLQVPSGGVSQSWAALDLIFAAALYLLLCVVLTLGHPFNLIIGEDGHYSNSKFQMFLWFGILISGYLASVCVKFFLNHHTTWGQAAIPNNLLLLSGMSALTFAGAKGITTSKVQTALDNGIADPKKATQNPNFLNDLMHNDNGKLDFGDFQMIVVTLVAAAMYIVLIFHYLGAMELRAATSLPDVDSTILASFGLGQGAYLTKKAVGNPGDT